MATRLQIDQLIPGGIRGDDYIHRGTNDNTCSRCREEIAEEDVPLMLWTNDGHNLMIYCEACLRQDRQDNSQFGVGA